MFCSRFFQYTLILIIRTENCGSYSLAAAECGRLGGGMYEAAGAAKPARTVLVEPADDLCGSRIVQRCHPRHRGQYLGPTRRRDGGCCSVAAAVVDVTAGLPS